MSKIPLYIDRLTELVDQRELEKAFQQLTVLAEEMQITPLMVITEYFAFNVDKQRKLHRTIGLRYAEEE